MSSIDQRIVEMQFNNSQFEKGIRESIQSLSDLKKGLKLNDSIASMEKLQKAGNSFSLVKMNDSLSALEKRFSAIGIAGMAVIDDLTRSAMHFGKTVASEITSRPILSGLREYETRINAIQTILSNTKSKGTTIDQVNEALDELNMYADKTIYNFTEMTRNIGTFTAAGVDLETSVSAIKGISNLGAISGSNPTQVATAMYQLSQAIASGTVRLMDWNSVVNAGMGGEVFQNALKETAKLYGYNVDQMIEKDGSFRETLHRGWLSTEVMLDTLKKFTGDLTKEQILAAGYTEKQAEEILALGKDANDAATKVKTFTQLIDTLREALGSGWAQSWEIIIGNFEEARDLWTGVSDVLGGMINASAESRNALLNDWKELGGRAALIEGLSDIFNSLIAVMYSVREAFYDIFPKTTAEDLMKISNAVKTFGDNLQKVLYYRRELIGYEQESYELSPGIETEVEALERLLKKGMSGEDVKKLQERLMELGYDVGPTGADGIFGKNTLAGLKAFQKEWGVTVDGIYGKDTHGKMIEALGLGKKETSEMEKGATTFNLIGKYAIALSNPLERLRSIVGGLFATLGVAFKFLKFGIGVVVSFAKALWPIGDAILTIGAKLGEAIINFNEWLDSSQAISKWGKTISDFFNNNITPKVKAFTDAFLKFFGLEWESGGINKAKDSFMNFANSLATSFGIIDGTDDRFVTFSDIWNRIVEAVKNSPVIDKFNSAIQNLGTAFADLKSTLATWYSIAKTYLGSKASELFESFVNNIPIIVDSALGYISTGIEGISSFIKRIPDIFAAIKKFFVDLYDRVRNSEKLFAVWEKTRTIFTSAVERIRSFIEFIKSIFSISGEMDTTNAEQQTSVIDRVIEAASSIWETVSSGIKKLVDSISSFWDEYGFWIISGAFIYSIYKLAIGIKKMAKSIRGLVSDLATIRSGGSSGTGSSSDIGETFMKIAISVGMIVAALYVLGKMDPHVLDRGQKALIAIGAALLAFVVVSRIVSAGKDAGKSIKAIGEALRDLAVAVGIITGIIWLVGNMNNSTFWNGAIKTFAMIGVLMFMISKVGKANIAIKGFIGFAAAIGVITLSVKALAGMNIDAMIQGLVGIGVVIGLMTLVIHSMSKLSAGSDGKIKMGGFLSLAIAIAIIGHVAKALGRMPIDQLVRGLLGVTVIIGMIAGTFYAMGKFGAGQDITKTAGLLVLFTAVVYAFAKIMELVKDIDPLTMISFAGSFAAAILALVGALTIMKKVGFKNAVLGSVGLGAAVGSLTLIASGVIALLGWINNTHEGGLVDNIRSGAEVLSALSDAFSGLSTEFEVFIGAVVGIGTVIGGISAATNTAIGPMIGGIFKLGIIVNVIAIITGLIVGLVGWLDSLMGGRILEAITRGGDLLEALGSAIGRFFGGILGETFQNALLKVSDAVSYISQYSNINEDNLGSIISALTALSGFFLSLNGLNFGDILKTFAHKIFLGKTPVDNFITNVQDLSAVLRAAAWNLSGFSESTASADFTAAIDVAEDLKEFLDLFDGDTGGILTAIGSFVNTKLNGTNFDNFLTDVQTFVDKVNEFSGKLVGIPEDLDDKTTIALDAAKEMATFFTDLNTGEDYQIDTDTTWLDKFIGKENSTNSYMNYLDRLSKSIGSFLGVFGELSSEDVTSRLGGSMDFIKGMGEFLSQISTSFDDGSGTEYTFDVAKIESFSNSLSSVLTSVDTLFGVFDNDEGPKILDIESLTAFVDSMERIATVLSTLGGGLEGDPINDLKTTLDTISKLFSGEGEDSLNSDNFLSGLDAETISTKLSTFVTNLGTSIENSTTTLSGYVTTLSDIGSDLGSAIISGIGSVTDMSGVTTLCDSVESTVSGYETSMSTAGYNLGAGLGRGIRNSRSFAVEAARYVAQSVVNKVKSVFDENSPSKVAEKIGGFFDEGLGIGIKKNTYVAEEASGSMASSVVESAKSAMSMLTYAITDGIDAEPVVRPVVDLTDVRMGVRSMNTMFGKTSTISARTTIDSANRISESMTKRSSNQNGNGSYGSDIRTSDNSVNVTGNTFYVRSEQDVHDLSFEIAALNRQHQRGIGS